MNKKGLIGLIVLVVILFVVGFFWFVKSYDSSSEFKECVDDFDCVPASCCHADSCVLKSDAPDCSGIPCTLECRANSLDCGQGSCFCNNGKCDVEFYKDG